MLIIRNADHTDLNFLIKIFTLNIPKYFDKTELVDFKKYFKISNKTLNSIESKTPLADLLVEKASILI